MRNFLDFTRTFQEKLDYLGEQPRIYIDVLIENEDRFIPFTSIVQLKNMRSIENGIDLAEGIQFGQTTIYDLILTFSNNENFFQSKAYYKESDTLYIHPDSDYAYFELYLNEWRPFRDTFWIVGDYNLDWNQSTFESEYPVISGQTRLISKYYKNTNRFLLPGDKVKLTKDGSSVETGQVTRSFIFSDWINDQYKNIVDITGISSSYNTGDMISTQLIQGTPIKVNLSVAGASDKIQLFNGAIRNQFMWKSDGYVDMTIENKSNKYFKVPIRIKNDSNQPLYYCDSDGSLINSINNEFASGTLDDVTIYEGCRLGQWIITFTSSTDYNITGPGIESESGDINSDFIDSKDQIKISSSDWSGSFGVGETVSFYTSANFVNLTVAEAMYHLLTIYLGISNDEIDVSATGITDTSESAREHTFNLCEYLATDNLNFSISNSTNIGNLAAIIGKHALTWLLYADIGQFNLFMINPDFHFDFGDDLDPYYPSWVNPTIQPDLHERHYIDYRELNKLIYNLFEIQYGYSNTQNQYDYGLFYPNENINNPAYKIKNNFNNKELTFYGYRDETTALKWAKRYYSVFKMGLRRCKITTTLRFLGLFPGHLMDTPPRNELLSYTANKDLIVYNVRQSFIDKNRIEAYCYERIEKEDDVW